MYCRNAPPTSAGHSAARYISAQIPLHPAPLGAKCSTAYPGVLVRLCPYIYQRLLIAAGNMVVAGMLTQRIVLHETFQITLLQDIGQHILKCHPVPVVVLVKQPQHDVRFLAAEPRSLPYSRICLNQPHFLVGIDFFLHYTDRSWHPLPNPCRRLSSSTNAGTWLPLRIARLSGSSLPDA